MTLSLILPMGYTFTLPRSLKSQIIPHTCIGVKNERSNHFLASSGQATPRFMIDNRGMEDFNATSINDGVATISDTIAKRIAHRALAKVNQELRQKRIQKKAYPIQKSTKESDRLVERLELKWNIDKISDGSDPDDITTSSDPCDTCRGRGVLNCQFCKGHGYIDFGAQGRGTIGGRMAKKNGDNAGMECPVCDENGQQECQKCNGNGWIARWKK
eukprot:CAMPEP_0197239228 /NCGR_PEP_ID=MMETSP1429-20130617/5731_1 /TAXON_ID=49237 /ORGANISM="Chaetoceros  sp., Strain UNC1202" /LENGTH=214 /DNA_ID=CAMNT_0042698609 /DNA_START=252 /DNA_END=896 /DNA_ORIENTATION=+